MHAGQPTASPTEHKTAFLWHHVPQAYESISRVPDSYGGDQIAKEAMRACLVLTPHLCDVSPLHFFWSHHHAVLAPPWEEILQWSPPWAQPACSQSRGALKGHFGQDGHALQCGLERPAAEGRKSAPVKRHVRSVATSTKHQVALLFRQVLSLRKCRGLGWIFLTEDSKDITWFHNESLKLEKGNSPGKSEGVIKRTW